MIGTIMAEMDTRNREAENGYRCIITSFEVKYGRYSVCDDCDYGDNGTTAIAGDAIFQINCADVSPDTDWVDGKGKLHRSGSAPFCNHRWKLRQERCNASIPQINYWHNHANGLTQGSPFDVGSEFDYYDQNNDLTGRMCEVLSIALIENLNVSAISSSTDQPVEQINVGDEIENKDGENILNLSRYEYVVASRNTDGEGTHCFSVLCADMHDPLLWKTV
jgi:hypothetical protein